MQAYRLRLYHGDRPDLNVDRTLFRDSDAEAIDAAQRWLSLHRRTTPALKPFDHWSVFIVDGRNHLPRIVASGGYSDGRPQPTDSTFPYDHRSHD